MPAVLFSNMYQLGDQKMQSTSGSGSLLTTTQEINLCFAKLVRLYITLVKCEMLYELLKIATFNVRGLSAQGKIQHLINDCDRRDIDILAVQETHLTQEINQKIFSNHDSNNKRQYHFINLGTTNRFHGIAFIVKVGFTFSYTKLHDWIGVVHLEFHSKKGSKKTLNIYNTYAPWKHEHPETEIVYNILNKDLENQNKLNFVCGDFNATLGDSHADHPQHIGSYGKDKTNQNGKTLIDFLTQNDLYVTNTFFKHKLSHVTTFTSNLKLKGRRNPIRKQIDFILAHKTWKKNNTNARSYINTNCDSDHRIQTIGKSLENQN